MNAPLLERISPDEFGFWEAYHLLNRAGFGGTPEQVRLLADWGPDQSVEHLIRFTSTTAEPVREDEFDSTIMAPLSAEERMLYRRAQNQQREDVVERFRMMRQERQRDDRRQIRNIQKWWLERIIETARPLEEKMALFYHGHFATGYRTIENSYHMFMQNQLFRKYAVGNFGDLCFQIIRDPAMIAYLDNNESHKRSPNENLARELMELFTLGEGVAYDERDIKEGARALTGFTFNHNSFYFNEEWHDTGSKRILGRTGNFGGDDFVKIILSRTETSEFIAYKLYRYFVNDLPDGPNEEQEAFIKALARTMRSSKYDMAKTLEALFMSKHFYDDSNRAAQIKSPVQITVQALRSLHTPVLDLNILVEALDLMGQNIFFPPNVKGWAGGRSWINTSTMYVRQNLMTHLLTGRMPYGYTAPGVAKEFDPMHLLAHLDRGPDGYDAVKAVKYLAHFCFGQSATEDRATELTSFVNESGGRITKPVLVGLLCLITAMPEYQLC